MHRLAAPLLVTMTPVRSAEVNADSEGLNAGLDAKQDRVDGA